MTQEHIQAMALSFLPGIGGILAKNLVSYCGGLDKVFTAPKAKLLKVPGIGDKTANSILKGEPMQRAEEELKFVEKYGIKVLYFQDDDYPVRLKECVDCPLILYYKGNADLNADKVLAIVGTRNATDYGKDFACKLVEELADPNILIVSGLAYGIDAAAHKAALEFGNPTIGAVAHGLQMLYPAQHKNLAKQMVENGGLLTEATSQETMVPGNFPRRNRIVAGMSDAVLVLESAITGGALITANIANSYNRDVFALAGKHNATYSKGCNFLIKTHKAALIESAEDLKLAMGWDDGEKRSPVKQRELLLELNAVERKIVDPLREKESLAVDELRGLTGLSSGQLASTLLELEMKGLISSMPGKQYKLL